MLKIFNRFRENKIDETSHINERFEQLEQEILLYKKAFNQIETVANSAADGDMSARIISWDEFGELSPALSALNKSYDLGDAFIRESSASLQAAQNKEYHRIFLTRGMNRDFGNGANIINEAARATKTMERAHEMLESSSEMGNEIASLKDASEAFVQSIRNV